MALAGEIAIRGSGRTVRELVEGHGSAPWQMPDADADRLAEAIAVLGQARVLEIAEAHARVVRPT